MTLDLSDLTAFVTVARAGGFREGARAGNGSASSPRLRRLSWTACVNASRENAGFHDPSAPRPAPILVTMTSPAG